MLKFDEKKAIEVLLYFLNKGGGRLELYKLIKLVYFSDKKHLKEFGRTITGDMYARMKHGPTASGIYDLLKSLQDDSAWPFDVKKHLKATGKTIKSNRQSDIDEFSDSELWVMDQVYEEDGEKTFSELKAKAHDKAYLLSTNHWMNQTELAEGDITLIEHIRSAEENDRFIQSW